jgi:hypothetical protein
MKNLTKNINLFLLKSIPLSPARLRDFVILNIILFSIISCGENATETFEVKGKAYYPLTIGKTITYNVDSVIYDPESSGFVKIDTTKWQFREDIVDTFRGRDGSVQYKIERFERRRGATVWSIGKVLTASITDQYALRDEDNLRYVKFPMAFLEKTNWDGNIFNDPSVKIIIAGELLEPFSKKWDYQIESFGKSETIGGKVFEDVLTVSGKTDIKILTETRSLVEKYAKGVGLVSKELKILDTQKLDPNMAWEKKAEKGVIVRYTFVQ